MRARLRAITAPAPIATEEELFACFRRTVAAARVPSMCAWCQRVRTRAESVLEPPDAAVLRIQRALALVDERLRGR